MDTIKLVDDYLNRDDWRVSENANLSYSLQGLNNYMVSHVSALYWLDKIYPVHISNAHKNGDLHIHDLALLASYCCGWSLYDLLLQGFCGVGMKAESAPAKHFGTALGQLVNFFYSLQNESAGAMAVSSFDTLLAPFVFYDHLNYEQVKQCMQEFIFNMNVPTRTGGQCPFTNITLDLEPSPVYAGQSCIVGGKPRKLTYGDFQTEMTMINRAFAEIMTEGDAKGRIFSFPIPTYNITKDFDWNNPDLEPIWRMTTKFGIPYFANFINSDMKPEDARSLCCRLRLDTRELHKRGGGLFGSNPLVGSVGVVTLNIPRLAYKASDENQFFDFLAGLMDIAKESLEIKRQVIEQYTEQGLYPYSRVYLDAVKQRTGKYWANHFSTIGLIGVNEACVNLFGENIASEKGRAFAVKILEFMRERIMTYQEQTGSLFNLEASPAEGTSYRLAKMDKARWPDTATQGGDVPYYTNSSQLPVNYTDDIFEMLEHQDDLQILYTGGTVAHLFLGEQLDDWQQTRLLIRKVTENYRLPYISITPTFSICPEHKYLSGQVETCPYCGRDCEVYSRVVGYIRAKRSFNAGKQQEFKERVTYQV